MERLSKENIKSAVIGCDRKASCGRHLHPDNAFFSISLGSGADLCWDIRQPIPTELRGRFDLVMTECLDYTAYNELPFISNSKGANQGFDNILEMTRENGFIFIVGSGRFAEFRQCVSSRNLKYIELDNNGHCILIAKNQDLTIEQIKQIISDPKWENLIKKGVDYQRSLIIPNGQLMFCGEREFATQRDKWIELNQTFQALSWNDKLLHSINSFVDHYQYPKGKTDEERHLLDNFKSQAVKIINNAQENNRDCDINELKNLANKLFKHSDLIRRAILDFLLCLTIIFPMIRIAQRKSPLFFQRQVTRQQIDFENFIDLRFKEARIK